MAEAAVLRDRFERVADGVAEVEDAAQAALALVLRHDVGLDAARLDDGRHEHRRVAREDRLGVAREAIEERRGWRSCRT